MDFFILGNPRSGTTLLRLMLNNHSLIGVPPESGFLHWWYKKYKNWSIKDSTTPNQVNDFITDLLSSKKIETWQLNKIELKEFITIKKPKNYSELIDCIYLCYCHPKKIIGDKNNYFINYLEDLKEIMPDSKYIHIVRDGRDVACSYLEIKKIDQNLQYIPKLPSDISEIAIEWNNNVNNIESFMNHEKSITIRYEDLILFPEQTLKDLCLFIGVNYESKMLNYHEYNNEPQPTIHWKKKTKQPIDSSNMKLYLNKLSKTEINSFNSLAHSNLLKFGYDK